jgi:hypothetical protein
MRDAPLREFLSSLDTGSMVARSSVLPSPRLFTVPFWNLQGRGPAASQMRGQFLRGALFVSMQPVMLREPES